MKYYNEYISYVQLIETANFNSVKNKISTFFDDINFVYKQCNNYSTSMVNCTQGLELSNTSMNQIMNSIVVLEKKAGQVFYLAVDKCIKLQELLKQLKLKNEQLDSKNSEYTSALSVLSQIPKVIQKKEETTEIEKKTSEFVRNPRYSAQEKIVNDLATECSRLNNECKDLSTQINLIITTLKSLNNGDISMVYSSPSLNSVNDQMIEIPYNISDFMGLWSNDKPKADYSEYSEYTVDNPVKIFVNIGELEKALEGNPYKDIIISSLTNTSGGGKAFMMKSKKGTGVVYDSSNQKLEYQEEAKIALSTAFNQILNDSYKANGASTQEQYQMISSTIMANNPLIQFRYGAHSANVAWTEGTSTFIDSGQFTCHKFVGWSVAQGLYNINPEDASKQCSILKNINEFTTNAVMKQIGHDKIKDISSLVPGTILIRDGHVGIYAGTMTNSNGDIKYLVNEANGGDGYFAVMTKVYDRNKLTSMYSGGTVSSQKIDTYLEEKLG